MTADRPITTAGILESVYDQLLERTDLETVPLSRITVGEHKILVAADDDRFAGLIHRPSNINPSVDATCGLDAIELASWAVEPPTETGEETLEHRALGVAALNALSAPYVDWRRGDPMASLSNDVDVVATVGFFRPALKHIDPVELRVVERKPIDIAKTSVPEGVSLNTYFPDEADDAFQDAQVLFLTGSAFVYGGAGRYLELADEETTVVVIGATASFLPEPVFAAGADVIAGARVTNVDAAVSAIDRDVCGRGLYNEGLEKVYVSAGTAVDGLRMNDKPSR